MAWWGVFLFVCFGAKPTQRACAREDEKRQSPLAVKRSRGKATVRERRLLSKELGPVDSEVRSANVRGCVSVPAGCMGISPRYTPAISTDTQKTTEGCQNLSLLVLWAKPGLCLFVLLSSTLGYTFCVCWVFVKHVKCPWPEMRETTRRSEGHELV